MDITNTEIADLLRRAHDEMLIRGRTTGVFINDDDEVCLVGALAVACGINPRPNARLEELEEADGYALFRDAVAVMAVHGFSAYWNDIEASDDDVLDAFLNTEKELREQIG